MATGGGGDFLRRLQKEEETQQRQTHNSRRPKYTRFSQQELPSCKPLLTPRAIVALYCLLGALCIPVGLLTLRASWSVVELTFRYDTFCIMKYATPSAPLLTDDEKSAFMQDYNKRKNCTVAMNVSNHMKPPIYVYYELSNYYQNHRRYVQSVSDRQLRGLRPSDSDLNNCKPEAVVNGQMVCPCGMVAWSLFNDTFEFSTNGFYSEPGTLYINQTGIAMKTDREERFNNTVFPFNFVNNNRTTVANASQIGGGWLNSSQPLSMNENLMVWMNIAAFPTFRKLYGRIESDLPPGTTLTININNLYNTYGFRGSKKVVLSTTSWIGGRNDCLGLAYLVTGCVSIAVGLVYAFVNWKNPRPLGAKSYLSWVRKSAAAATANSN